MLKLNDYNEMLEMFETNHSCSDSGPGFHGDLRLIELTDILLKNSDAFIETGTNMGNTLYFVSRNYDISCFSCEIISNRTPSHVIEYSNVYWRNTNSPSFLYDIVEQDGDLLNKKCLFYLDAHFDNQIEILFSELEFIINNFSDYYIFVDDCDINNNLFLNNGYNIDDIITRLSSNDKVFIPNYSDGTSQFHDLCGWALITNSDESEFVNVEEYCK